MTYPTNGNGHANGHANGNGHYTAPASRLGALADRVPPQNLEAERSVLGSILLNNAVLPDVLKLLKVDHFYRATHQIIYAAMLDLHGREIAIDPVTLSEDLNRRGQYDEIGGDDGLRDIIESVPFEVNAAHYADIVRQKSLARQSIETANRMLANGYSNNFTGDQLVEEAAKLISSVEQDVRSLDDEPEPDIPVPWPAPIAEAAYYGPVGEWVKLIEPHTEADPVALLVQFLVGFGNLVGRGPHYRVESTNHRLNLFGVLVGESSRARKGTAWDHAHRALASCEPDWAKRNIHRGLSSGEGMVWPIRDPIYRREKVDDSYEEKLVDPGVEDKRALFVESEFGSVLAHYKREGNVLNATMRQLWDGQPIGSLTKNSPTRCAEPHGSLIGHITFRELKDKLSGTDISNGLANRVLWICCKRSKLLSRGGSLHTDQFEHVYHRFQSAADFARTRFGDFVPIQFATAAGEIWDATYPRLTAIRTDVIGEVTSRAEGQVIRLACIYAVLDHSSYIEVEHLEAALAVWDYAERSAAVIFGASLSDPQTDKALRALQRAGREGLTATMLNRRAFGAHMKKADLTSLLKRLEEAGTIRPDSRELTGRKLTFFILSTPGEMSKSCDNATHVQKNLIP